VQRLRSRHCGKSGDYKAACSKTRARQATPRGDEPLRGCYSAVNMPAPPQQLLLACLCVLKRVSAERPGKQMNHQNIVAKLNQIVEQAQLTLQDPGNLTRERQRMIIALARFVSNEIILRSVVDASAFPLGDVVNRPGQ
jgi:hypothetical protein